MYEHPDLLLSLAYDHQRELLAEADRRRLLAGVLRGRRGRRGRHARGAREPSPGEFATAARPAGTFALR
jgi:hypothetical protein